MYMEMEGEHVEHFL